MQRIKEHVRRQLARKARAGSAPKTVPVTGTGRRWTKSYRKPGEIEHHRAAAWAKVELIK